MLPQKEFAALSGWVCPACKYVLVKPKVLETVYGENEIVMYCECVDCGASWDMIWRPVAFARLEGGSNEPDFEIRIEAFKTNGMVRACYNGLVFLKGKFFGWACSRSCDTPEHVVRNGRKRLIEWANKYPETVLDD